MARGRFRPDARRRREYSPSRTGYEGLDRRPTAGLPPACRGPTAGERPPTASLPSTNRRPTVGLGRRPTAVQQPPDRRPTAARPPPDRTPTTVGTRALWRPCQ